MTTSRTLSVAAAVLLAALTGTVAGGVGFAGGWIAHPEAPVAPAPIEQVAEVEAVDPMHAELSTAQARVAELERTVATQEGEVAEMKARMARGADAGNALRERIAALETELATTREALVRAEEEKEVLLVQLRETTTQLEEREAQLAMAVDQRDLAREEALYNRWQAFTQNAQLEICDKGGRKKLGNCRETVLATLTTDARRDQYAHCVRSGQAEPSVAEAVKDVGLPDFAQMIDEEAKQTKGWYVAFCDPTLPEADGVLADGLLPPTGDADAEG